MTSSSREPERAQRRSRRGEPNPAEAIRRAAARVLERKGFERATLADIADELGRPHGSIHYHIESKQDLLFDILSSGWDDLHREVTKVAAYPLPAIDRLRLVLREHVRNVVDPAHSYSATATGRRPWSNRIRLEETALPDDTAQGVDSDGPYGSKATPFWAVRMRFPPVGSQPFGRGVAVHSQITAKSAGQCHDNHNVELSSRRSATSSMRRALSRHFAGDACCGWVAWMTRGAGGAHQDPPTRTGMRTELW